MAWGGAYGLFTPLGVLRRGLSPARKPPALSDVRSILAIRLDLLGDLVFTLPAVRALHEAAPSARLTLLVQPYAADLVGNLSYVDRVVTVDVQRWRKPGVWTGPAWSELRRALSELRGERYDLCVSFYGRIGAAAALLSGARYLVGYASEGYPCSFDRGLPGRRYLHRQHEAEYCLDLVRALGVSASQAGSTLEVDPQAAVRVEGLLSAEGVAASDRLVTLHPGALNMAAKRWIPDRWAAVADRVQEETGRRVVLVGSASERPLVEGVRESMRTVPIDLAGRTTVAELVAILARCELFLGGDSGPLHMASAVGLPSVSVYGPTDPALTGPLLLDQIDCAGRREPPAGSAGRWPARDTGGRAARAPSIGSPSATQQDHLGEPSAPSAVVLRSGVDCSPCYDLASPPVCRRGDLRCMVDLSTEQVWEAISDTLCPRREGARPLPPPGHGRAMRPMTLPISYRAALHCRAAGDEPLPYVTRTGLQGMNPCPTLALQVGVPVVAGTPAGDGEQGSSGRLTLRRILVVKLAGIGDLLSAFPALEALRKGYPDAEITALVTPSTASLLDGSGLVDRTMVLDKYLFDDAGGALRPRSLAALLGLARELRSRSFDAVLLLHHLITWPGVAKYGLLTLATGAPWRLGLDDGRGRFLNLPTRDGGFGAMHEVDYWLRVVGGLGVGNSDPRVRLRWGSEDEAFAADRWRALGLDGGQPVMAIHPGCGSYSPVRRWSAERFAAVADALADDGLVPLVVAGPGEEGTAREVMEGMRGRGLLLGGVPTPMRLAALLARCRLFVGNDSGVMHLAVAAGLPVVAVFGPSNHRAWGPYDPSGRMSRVVRLDLPCSPCLYRGQSLGLRYGCGDPRCLQGVTPEMVVSAARDLLAVEQGR